MGAWKEVPAPAEITLLQEAYVIELTAVLAEHRRIIARCQHDPERLRAAKLREDCVRFEYLRMFADPRRAHEAWEQQLHPLYARYKGYN